MLKFLSLAACLTLAAPAFAKTDATNESVPDADKVVCKREASTGWRTSKSTKVCRTKAEWAQISRQAQREVRGKDGRGSMN